MQRVTRVLATFILCVGAAVSAYEAQPQPILVATQLLPDLLEPDADFAYNRLMAELFRDSPVPVTITTYPGARAVRLWADKHSRCLFGNVTIPHRKQVQNSVISAQDFATMIVAGPFNELKLLVFSAPETQMPISMSMLDQKTIGIDIVAHGDLALYAPAYRDLNFVKLDSAEEALSLVEKGRAAHAIAYDIDAAVAMQKQPSLTSLNTNQTIPILAFEENLACWPGPGTNDLVDHVQKRIDTMKEQGKLSTYLPTLP